MRIRRSIALAAAALAVAALSACNTPRSTGGGGFPGGGSTRYEPQPLDPYTANRADCGVTFRPLLMAYQAVTGSCEANGLDFVQDRSRVSLDYLAQTTEIWSISVTVSEMADDSVRSERHRVDLQEMADGTWTIVAVGRTQQCWPDRGHQDFRPDPCL